MLVRKTPDASLLNYKAYLGNSLLKRSGVKVEWTPELVEEYAKCSRDCLYFIENYVQIISLDVGLVPFLVRDYQREMLDAMATSRFVAINTCRQCGKSTTVSAYILWYVIFHKDKTVALLANKGETAREILGRVQLAYMHLPKWLQQGVVEWNKGSFELENNSRVLAAATSSDAIRGYSINLLFIDEAAHIENWDEFSASVMPTVTSGKTTQVVLVSTPNGLNHFWKYWKDSQEGRNEYKRVEVTWQRVPGRDEKWRADTLALLGGDLDKFAQENECSFLGSSGTLIAGWKLKELAPDSPLRYRDGLSQYVEPVRGHTYTCTVDVSEGKGLDYSTFQIVDVTSMPYDQVCVYRNNFVTPSDFASVVYQMARAYNEAAVLIETNVPLGHEVSMILHGDYEYENLIYTASAGSKGKRITAAGGPGVDRGIRTTKGTKATGCSVLKLLIEQNQLRIRDFHTIEELSRFSRKNASYEAEPGSHDDLVMALVIFAWLSAQGHFSHITDVNTLQRLRDRTEEEESASMLSFGFVDDGRGEHVEVLVPAASTPYEDLDPGSRDAWAGGTADF